LAGLERTFDFLAQFPKIGRSVQELAPGFRRFRFQAHIIFYTEAPEFVVIRAVLHHSREIKPDVFE
jgi:toxin ParE1/3/4